MKVCTYCRREVENNIAECPYCGAAEFFTKSSEKILDEKIQASDKRINESLESMQHKVPVKDNIKKNESLIYRIVKYILLGILFYMLLMVVLVVILLLYFIITGRVPEFIMVLSG